MQRVSAPSWLKPQSQEPSSVDLSSLHKRIDEVLARDDLDEISALSDEILAHIGTERSLIPKLSMIADHLAAERYGLDRSQRLRKAIQIHRDIVVFRQANGEEPVDRHAPPPAPDAHGTKLRALNQIAEISVEMSSVVMDSQSILEWAAKYVELDSSSEANVFTSYALCVRAWSRKAERIENLRHAAHNAVPKSSFEAFASFLFDDEIRNSKKFRLRRNEGGLFCLTTEEAPEEALSLEGKIEHYRAVALSSHAGSFFERLCVNRFSQMLLKCIDSEQAVRVCMESLAACPSDRLLHQAILQNLAYLANTHLLPESALNARRTILERADAATLFWRQTLAEHLADPRKTELPPTLHIGLYREVLAIEEAERSFKQHALGGIVKFSHLLPKVSDQIGVLWQVVEEPEASPVHKISALHKIIERAAAHCPSREIFARVIMEAEKLPPEIARTTLLANASKHYTAQVEGDLYLAPNTAAANKAIETYRGDLKLFGESDVLRFACLDGICRAAPHLDPAALALEPCFFVLEQAGTKADLKTCAAKAIATIAPRFWGEAEVSKAAPKVAALFMLAWKQTPKGNPFKKKLAKIISLDLPATAEFYRLHVNAALYASHGNDWHVVARDKTIESINAIEDPEKRMRANYSAIVYLPENNPVRTTLTRNLISQIHEAFPEKKDRRDRFAKYYVLKSCDTGLRIALEKVFNPSLDELLRLPPKEWLRANVRVPIPSITSFSRLLGPQVG
jgi:hypothetical protein